MPLLWCRLDEAHLLLTSPCSSMARRMMSLVPMSVSTIGAIKRVHAEWRKYDQAAGPIRNQKMLADYKPALLIAGPGKHGTANMMDLGRKAGIEIWEVR